jgi:hypothetical protein
LRLEKEMRVLGPTRRQRRICVTAGTNDAQLIRRMREMLGDLQDIGRIDLLRAIRDGRLTPMQVWSAFKNHELERLPTEEEMRALGSDLEAFRKTHDVGAKHRASLQTSFKALLRQATKPSVSDLPALVMAYREECREQHHPRSFNLARAAALAFLRRATDSRGRKLYGRTHKLYLAVAEVESLPYKRGKGHPQLPKAARAIAQDLDEPWGGIWWGMCLTGMGPDEYWGDWSVERDRVRIAGTKREARDRFVPLVGQIATPQMTPWGMQSAFRRMRAETGRDVTVYDARRSFTLWMVEAGVPRIRRKLYLGHEITDVHDLYEEHEVQEFLAEDGVRLRGFIGERGRQLQAI